MELSNTLNRLKGKILPIGAGYGSTPEGRLFLRDGGFTKQVEDEIKEEKRKARLDKRISLNNILRVAGLILAIMGLVKFYPEIKSFIQTIKEFLKL